MSSVPQNLADRRLLQRLFQRENGAWEEFQARYEALIRACTRRVLRRYNAEHTSDDIEDLVADIWLLLLKDDKAKLRRFDPERGVKLSSWIGLVATNTVIDALRRRRKHTSLDEIPEIQQISDAGSSPQAALEREQARAVAERAMARLTSEERMFLLACYHEERPPAELAIELGVSLNTIYSRKFKVRAKLTKIVTQLCRPQPMMPSYAA